MYHNTLPYSFKYLEENPIFGSRWFIFGETKTHANVADRVGDVFINIPKEQALKLIKARDEFVDKMEEINEELGGSRRMYEPSLTQ